MGWCTSIAVFMGNSLYRACDCRRPAAVGDVLVDDGVENQDEAEDAENIRVGRQLVAGAEEMPRALGSVPAARRRPRMQETTGRACVAKTGGRTCGGHEETQRERTRKGSRSTNRSLGLPDERIEQAHDPGERRREAIQPQDRPASAISRWCRRTASTLFAVKKMKQRRAPQQEAYARARVAAKQKHHAGEARERGEQEQHELEDFHEASPPQLERVCERLDLRIAQRVDRRGITSPAVRRRAAQASPGANRARRRPIADALVRVASDERAILEGVEKAQHVGFGRLAIGASCAESSRGCQARSRCLASISKSSAASTFATQRWRKPQKSSGKSGSLSALAPTAAEFLV